MHKIYANYLSFNFCINNYVDSLQYIFAFLSKKFMYEINKDCGLTSEYYYSIDIYGKCSSF